MKNKIGGLFGRGSTRTKVDGLLSQQSEIDRKLDKIRQECHHTNQTLKLINDGGTHSWTLRWVCDECLRPVGWPSEHDKQKFLKN